MCLPPPSCNDSSNSRSSLRWCSLSLTGVSTDDVAVEVARVAGAHALDAFAAQTELFAGLGALWNVDGGFAVERGYIDLAAQRRCR